MYWKEITREIQFHEIFVLLPNIYIHFTEAEEKVKRDVRTVKKFIEVALVLDKAMFDKRPHSSRKDVIHDAIQVVCTGFFP